MSQIKGKDTKPEKQVRTFLWRNAYRYRLYSKDLPGKPDIVFRSRKKVIFVHGCFWHMHNCKYGRVKPKTNADFWEKKRTRTKERDKENQIALKKLGWKVLVIWECEVKANAFQDKVLSFVEK